MENDKYLLLDLEVVGAKLLRLDNDPTFEKYDNNLSTIYTRGDLIIAKAIQTQ